MVTDPQGNDTAWDLTFPVGCGSLCRVYSMQLSWAPGTGEHRWKVIPQGVDASTCAEWPFTIFWADTSMCSGALFCGASCGTALCDAGCIDADTGAHMTCGEWGLSGCMSERTCASCTQQRLRRNVRPVRQHAAERRQHARLQFPELLHHRDGDLRAARWARRASAVMSSARAPPAGMILVPARIHVPVAATPGRRVRRAAGIAAARPAHAPPRERQNFGQSPMIATARTRPVATSPMRRRIPRLAASTATAAPPAPTRRATRPASTSTPAHSLPVRTPRWLAASRSVPAPPALSSAECAVSAPAPSQVLGLTVDCGFETCCGDPPDPPPTLRRGRWVLPGVLHRRLHAPQRDLHGRPHLLRGPAAANLQ